MKEKEIGLEQPRYPQRNPQELADTVRGVLETYDGWCTDNESEREALTLALVMGITEIPLDELMFLVYVEQKVNEKEE